MSAKHPVIAITGSSGAGTSTVKKSFEHIFRRESILAAVIEGTPLPDLPARQRFLKARVPHLVDLDLEDHIVRVFGVTGEGIVDRVPEFLLLR